MAVRTERAHPSKETAGGLVAVPTSLTAVTSTNTFVEQLYVSNTTAGSINLTVQDFSANKILATVPVPANSTAMWNWPSLLFSTGGVKWQASGAGLVAELFGYTSQY